MTRPFLSCLLAAVVLAASAAPGVAGSGRATPQGTSRSIGCSDAADAAHRLVIRVNGDKATGHYALPKGDPRGLVVYAHGYGHTSYSWVEHLKMTANKGYAAVAMDYRGLKISPDSNDDGLPESRGWPAMAGAQDLLAATRLFDRFCPTIEKIALLGYSMGANMAGLALAIAGEEKLTRYHRKTEPLYDHWLDIQGAVNVTETYLEARTVAVSGNQTAVNAVEDIEAEMGGPIETHRDAYLQRTVVARSDDILAAGLDSVTFVHSLNDGLVPYNQSREMVSLLAGRIPSDFFTVTLRDGDSEKETTATGYITDQVDKNHVTPLAGHGSEKSQTHIIVDVAFDRLFAVMKGAQAGPYREFLVNGDHGYLPTP